MLRHYDALGRPSMARSGAGEKREAEPSHMPLREPCRVLRPSQPIVE